MFWIASGLFTAGLGVLFSMTGRKSSPVVPVGLLVCGGAIALIGLATL
jgi:hypothetical protein